MACAPAAAQRLPVSVEVVAEAKAPAAPEPIWSGDGKRFALREEKRIVLFDLQSRRESDLVDLASLEKEIDTVEDAGRPFHWTNRGVKELPLQWAPDNSFIIFPLRGEIFRCETASRRIERITRTRAVEQDPKLSPDGRRVSFQRDNNLYVLNLATRKESALTEDGSTTLWNARLDWVYPEELEIPSAHWWSPDSRWIAYLQFDVSPVMSYPHADTLGLRPVAEPQRFPQAGTPNSRVRLGVAPAGGGRTRWIDLGAPADRLVGRVTWLPAATSLVVHKLTRVQNRIELIHVEAATGRTRRILEESGEAWVNLRDDFRFLPDSAALVWGSERTGYRHFYLHPLAGGAGPIPLTSGDWETTALNCADAASRLIYFTATAVSPLERHLYRTSFDGRAPEKLTREKGSHTINMAPGCAYYIDTWSSLAEPPRSILRSTDGAVEHVLRAANREETDKYEILPVEILSFRGRDGALFYARLLKPAGFKPGVKYPAVVQVYGGPHAQHVRDAWRGADWDQALAHRGFVVWQMDNRGTSGRGHLWESPLRGRFGKRELADQLEGISHLVSLGFVDAERIGVNGWSYGGFMTLYSLFNAPETFRSGIAGAPVTDWRQYDTIYTERYLGLPSDNEEGYRDSSPVNQAAKLKGRLLLVHNLEDDNVLFQHTARMIKALQEEGKQFELMLYPQKSHAVSGKAKTHLLRLQTEFFERTLKE